MNFFIISNDLTVLPAAPIDGGGVVRRRLDEDYAWLKELAGVGLTGDEAKALIYARETGVVDNTACRDFSGLDTLQASNLLRRLRDRGLLEKQGAGSRTHYTLTLPQDVSGRSPDQGELPLEGGNRASEGGKQLPQGGKRVLPDLPPELAARLPQLRQRLGEAALRALIRDLCGWQALRGEELATLLHKDLKYLRNKHLTEMVQTGELAFLFPESPNHALHGLQAAGKRFGVVMKCSVRLISNQKGDVDNHPGHPHE